MRHLIVFMLCLAWAPALLAQPDSESARIAWTAERGRLLFDIDRAAWVGTDDMLARIPNAGSGGMRGYVVEREGAGYSVIFYGGPAAAPVAFYRGRVEGGRVVSRDIFPADARPRLTPLQQRLAGLRDLVPSLERQPCGDRPFNTAAIPPDTPDGPIDLYLLTPQVRANNYPLGGHYRFTIAADGRVLSDRAFSNSCIDLGPPPGDQSGPNAVMFITHSLDPIPTEIHVFTSLTAGAPLGVGIVESRRMWWIEEGRISRGQDLTPPNDQST